MKTRGISIELMVEDVDQAVSFYKDALEFKMEAIESDEDDKSYWAKLSKGTFFISFKEKNRLRSESDYFKSKDPGGAIAICLQIDDLEGYYVLVKDKLDTLDYPHITPCGSTQFSLKDPDGYVITFEKF